MRYRYLYYLLLLISAFIFRDFTPANELKYISIADEALQSGTWFTFYNHGEIYADKPPLFFWLIMLSKLITGGYHMWLIGLFSLLPSMGIMAMMDRWLRNEEAKFNPVVANLMLLTTIMFIGATLVVRMDMLMTFFIVLSLYTFYNIYKDEHADIEKYLLPVYIFLALFTKGPIGLFIPVVSIIVFLLVKKQIRTIGHYLGWRQCLIFLGLCVIWFVLVYMEGGREYLHDLLFKQTIGRGINSFHHKEPFWFYLPRMLWSFAPWSLLFIVLIWRGIHKKMFRSDMEKFFLTIICSSVILLSVISAKLDIYLLPVYPFVVYLCSILLEKNRNDKGVKISIIIPAIIVILILPTAIILKDKIPDLYSYSAIAYAAVAILAGGGIMALVCVYKNHVHKAIAAISCGLLGLVFVGSFAIPKLNYLIGFGEMVRAAEQTASANQTDKYVYYKFYTAPNMDIYIQKEIEYVSTVESLDSINRLPQTTILFVRSTEIRREKELGKWLSGLNAEWSNGQYSWYLIGKRNYNIGPLVNPTVKTINNNQLNNNSDTQ
ncbi:MAG: ArnT family glycosyltransferase [Parabacteroides sp.]|jgi:4-amino-4-deoxy-L-arabinose transferase-like glycosyltransferase|uniref:ArnT family glycosyltransferase n=1 Tax=Macellibacteroides sp. TaxID=2014584 RepID=UPI003E31FA16